MKTPATGLMLLLWIILRSQEILSSVTFASSVQMPARWKATWYLNVIMEIVLLLWMPESISGTNKGEQITL